MADSPGIRTSFDELSPITGREGPAGQPPARETVSSNTTGIPLLPLGTVGTQVAGADAEGDNQTRTLRLTGDASGFGLRLHDFGASEAFAGATKIHRRTDEGIVLSGVKEGSEAYVEGVRTGDILLRVGDVRVTPNNYDQVVSLLRNRVEGEEKTITVQKSGDQLSPRPPLSIRRQNTARGSTSTELKSGAYNKY